MKLLFVNELGPNYKGQNIYEFIFGESVEELWGEDWDAVPAHGKPGPPEIEYVKYCRGFRRYTYKVRFGTEL